MTRNTKIKLAIGGLVVPIGVALAAAGMQSGPNLTGETYALYAQTATGSLPRTADAILPEGGGMATGEAPNASLAGVLEAHALEASITGVGDIQSSSVQGYSSLGSVNILGGLIKADGVVAMTASMPTGSNAFGSGFANIEVNGVVLDNDVEPNTTLPLPGIGSVTLNEQTPGSDGGLTVHMIHVLLTDPLTGAQTGEIIVGSSRSGSPPAGSAPAPLATITVTPNPVSVPSNSTQQFTAVGHDASGNVVAITPVWSIVNGANSNSAINASSGFFTAGAAAAAFSNTVKATSGAISGTATVTVPSAMLGTAALNGIMAATTITCVTGGIINASISLSPGTAVTGFPPCVTTGVQHVADAVAAQAQLDLTTAYNTLAALPCPLANTVGTINLGGMTKTAGVYCSGSSIGVTGTLTLDGGGDPNATFVFQAGSTLTTAGSIVLINSAQAKNVYWLVGSSATLGTASQWKGTIIAVASITMVDNATIVGRALARNAAVTIGTGNVITLP
jgi:hypothetical protein